MGTASNIVVGVASVEVAYPVGAGYTNLGFTKDGVSIEYSATTFDVEVDEKTMPVDQHITKEGIKVTLNMSESSLYNLDKAIAGSVLAGSVITIGGAVTKKMSLRIIGKNPAGYDRTWLFPLVTATGNVGLKYTKKAETIVPVTFTILDSEITMTDTSGDSADITTLVLTFASGVVSPSPNLTASVYEYGVAPITTDAYVMVTVTDATAATITATALGVTWNLTTTVQSGHIVIGAADTLTDLTIVVTDSAKSPKTYTFHIVRPAP